MLYTHTMAGNTRSSQIKKLTDKLKNHKHLTSGLRSHFSDRRLETEDEGKYSQTIMEIRILGFISFSCCEFCCITL
jgi:hypothetical protein